MRDFVNMIITLVFLLCSMFGRLAYAAPVDSLEQPTRKRNVCDMGDAFSTPVMYQEYGSDVCPPLYTMDTNQNCPYNLGGVGNINPQCDTFCQVRKLNTN